LLRFIDICVAMGAPGTQPATAAEKEAGKAGKAAACVWYICT